MASKAQQLLRLAQEVADQTTDFFGVVGSGLGNLRTNEFMRSLRSQAEILFGEDLSEKKICGNSGLAVDFYLPSEETIVEVALSLRSPNTEFERDILKASLAQDAGYPVDRLVLLSKPGARSKHAQPSSRAMVDWVQRQHSLRVCIRELTSRR